MDRQADRDIYIKEQFVTVVNLLASHSLIPYEAPVSKDPYLTLGMWS